MGEMVVNSRVIAHLKFSQVDKFEARNRQHLHILVRWAFILEGANQKHLTSFSTAALKSIF
jgi:hypothetical protein